MPHFNRTSIAVCSATGGTGVSTIVKELATYFSNCTYQSEPISVCVVDMNYNFASLPTMFKITPDRTIIDLFDKVKKNESDSSTSSIDTIPWDDIERYITKTNEGELYILPAPVVGIGESNLELIDIISLDRSLKDHFDIVFYDTENGVNETTINTMMAADISFLVVTDNRNNICHSQFMRKKLRSSGFHMDHLNVILNAYSDNPSDRLNRISDIKLKIYQDDIFVLPFEKDMWISNNLFSPIVLINGDSPYKNALKKIVNYILPGTDF